MAHQDASGPSDRPIILIVDSDRSQARSLVEAVHPHRAVAAFDAKSALAMLDRHIMLILAASRLPDATGVSFLQDCAALSPDAVRILRTEYSELPEIVRASAAGVIHRAVPRTASHHSLRKIVQEALGSTGEMSVIRAPPTPQPGVEEAPALLRWTVEQLIRVRGVVLRELPPNPDALQQQFVIPQSEHGKLMERLSQGWPPAIKPRGQRVPLGLRRHPVVSLLGGLSSECELLALERGDGSCAFLALLPWRTEARVTVLLGVLAGSRSNGLRELFAELHGFAVRSVPEFALPRLPSDDEATGVGHPVLEYDWIVTPDYAGPDRRTRPTSFFNRFVFVGRRKRIPSRFRAVADGFIDRIPTRVWRYAAAYCLLSLLDACLTFRFVRDGTVYEMNPFLRPLVTSQPTLFFMAKNSLALVGLFAVTRLHPWRMGEHLLRATLLGYVLLDGYWLWLLFA